jgi:hypothetical protein
MKKAFLRKAIAIAGLLLILAFSATATNTGMVRADYQGTGKFLTIDVFGEGYVTATKPNSGETWLYNPPDTLNSYKVGAGAVWLYAVADPGWEFSGWGGALSGNDNPISLKTEKYVYVTATFKEKTCTITASAGLNGAIDPSGEVLVKYGESKTFTFTPDDGYHVSAIVVDGAYANSFAESYTFSGVTVDHTITVSFSEDGTATVPGGNDVTVFLDSKASLTLNAITSGVATGTLLSFPNGTSVTVWDINMTALFDGKVLIALQYNDIGNDTAEQELRLIRGDSIEALYSDVNNDLIVDGTDVSIVANAVKQAQWYNPLLDINNDGYVNEADIHLVNEYKGTTLQDITYYVDTSNNIIYGLTDHFSIFRAR